MDRVRKVVLSTLLGAVFLWAGSAEGNTNQKGAGGPFMNIHGSVQTEKATFALG